MAFRKKLYLRGQRYNAIATISVNSSYNEQYFHRMTFDKIHGFVPRRPAARGYRK